MGALFLSESDAKEQLICLILFHGVLLCLERSNNVHLKTSDHDLESERGTHEKAATRLVLSD